KAVSEAEAKALLNEYRALSHSPHSQPPPRSIHRDESLSKSSLEFWGKKTDQEIIDSLRPGQPEALRAYPDGRIANGNTRIMILRDRGSVDVNSLPREIHNP